ncbi:MAG: monomethylamine:corrinoid methyltransferase [Candidatus Bathyarchaeota archaeon]|nr:MAG: monomethylamine:corrinoid methyltransferase [Candidatus Bathyarchaeota archaeon]
MVSLRELYRRVYNGPLVTQKDFFSLDHFLHPLQALAKEYGITRDPNDYVPTDPGMADNLFQAGMAFLEEKGMWCMDTSRVVHFTRDEINTSLAKLPEQISFGEGTERVTVQHRNTGDKRQPIKLMGGWGVGCTSPELFLKAHQSVAQEEIDFLQDGVLTQIDGERVRLGTPEEYNAASMGARLLREAVRRAGKPGMPINFDCQAMSEYAHAAILNPGGARLTDTWTLWPSYPPATIRMVSLNRAAMSLEYSNPLFTYTTGSIYQFAGGSETSAIHMVADCIGLAMLDNVWLLVVGGASPPMRENTLPERNATWWTSQIASFAIFRNNKGITGGGGAGSRSGLCTEMQFYEGAAGRIACEPRTAILTGGASGGGGAESNESDDYINGITARWGIELGNEIVGLSLTDANDLVKTILHHPKYKLGKEPAGKKFQEAYNLETMQPIKEYLDLYNDVTRDVKNLLGINPK